MTGILAYIVNESFVGTTLLASCNDASPFNAATGFLKQQGFQHGERITVTGQIQMVQGRQALCMTSATRALGLA